jgi:hypothetical protein
LTDLSADRGLLLGTVGWDRCDWLSDYYPADLPAEWRLPYYANDCGCVLLPADSWCGMDRRLLAETLDEVEGQLVFFLEQPVGEPSGACANLSLFASLPAVLLVDRPDPGSVFLPQWVAQGAGIWVDRDSGAGLIRWQVDVMDLRELRARADALSETVRGLVLDGPAASPAAVPELRTMLELMGIA